MYNLGVAHLYGHGVPLRNAVVAAEWFEVCQPCGIESLPCRAAIWKLYSDTRCALQC